MYIYVCVYIYTFFIFFHYSLSQDIEYSSLCYTVGLNQLSLSVQRTDMEKKLVSDSRKKNQVQVKTLGKILPQH